MQVGFNNGDCGCTGTTSAGKVSPAVAYQEVGCSTEEKQPVDKMRVVGQKAVFNISVDVWDTVGCDTDNIVRVYNTGQCVYLDGLFYFSKQDMNITKPPSPSWSRGYTKCDILNPASTAGTAASCDWVNSLRPLV